MPLSHSVSCHADDVGGAERVEAIDKGDPDVDFGGLAIWIPRGDALTEGLQASHLGLDSATGVVSGPPLPECPTVVTRGAQGFVARLGSRAVLFPSSTVPSGRYDCRATACDDGAVAAAGIVGTIRGHGADVLVLGDLAQQVRQDWAVAFPARGELDGPDIRGGDIHRQMHLAPLAAALNAMLAGLPFAVAKKLDAGAVHQKIQRPFGTAIGDLHLEGLLSAAQRRVVRNGPV